MKHAAIALLLAAAPLFAQTYPSPAQEARPAQKPKPNPEAPKPAQPPMVTPQEVQKPAEHPLTALPYTPSLDLASMDRTADPCADFYQYVCGGWMKNNPIPPDQASWSVYGKLAEENGEFLWGILEDAAKPTPARTAVQQKIGDYFEACMDEAGIESRGAAPLQPLLHEIASLKSKSDLAHFLATEHPRTYGSGFLFGFGSDQDFGDATQVIAFAHAGGLGLPDRDYYTKIDAKSKEIRDKYVQHVANMLGLIGETKAKASADAATVLRIETALAKASLTRVERRDPYNLYHKMTPAQLAKLTPSFDWPRYLTDSGLAKIASVNVTEPKFFQALDHEIRSVPLSDWKADLRWHAVHDAAP
ncbi:MAG TPA: M13 family metallopeptidase N-terminal domain-containing protein, partial [Thermoanaerobaculia bacterium]|nr:M13 family metallopeptidase N-terminal domain-containing protein [Thermoanaerobaculia bacterium]